MSKILRGNAGRWAVERLIHSAANYWCALVVDVLAGLGFLLIGAYNFAGTLAGGVVAVLVGFLAWGGAEYAGHRWLLHGSPSAAQRAHARHHADGTALISAPAFLGTALASVAWGLLSLVLSPGLAALFVGGLYGGYNCYVLVHHLQHRHRALFVRLSTLERLEQAHRTHHRRHVVNFGVSTTWWDRLFGTYQAAGGPDAIRSRQRGSPQRGAPLHAR